MKAKRTPKPKGRTQAFKIGDVFTIKSSYVANPGPIVSVLCPHLTREEGHKAARDWAVAGLVRRAEAAARVCRSLAEDGRNALSDIVTAREQLDECERFAKAIDYLGKQPT